MNKKYLMNGFAALALVVGFSSCVKDVDGVSQAEQDASAKENAELQLGLNIPDGQTWDMSTQVTAVVDVNLNPSETYTVGICDKNPLNYDDAKFYVLKKADGGRISATFTAPIAKKDYYVIAYNSKYQAIVNQVEATNGAISAYVTRTSGASGTMRSASNRAIASTFKFPSAPQDDIFATTSLPAEAVLLKGYGEGEYFYINSTCEEVDQIQTEHKNRDASIPVYLYVDGTVDVSGVNNFYLCSGTKIILLPGAKLTLKDDYKFGQANVEVIIPETAELINNGYIQTESNVKIWNRGTITASYLNVTNGSLVYNEGTINLNGEDSNGLICVTNNNSVIVNDGTIECKEVEVRGSGHIQNNNSLTVDGPTNINSNDATWVNNGTYTTEYFIYTAGSTDVINNCRLIVEEDFNINLGDSPKNGFRMDANASVVTKNFNGGGYFTYSYYRTDWYRYVDDKKTGGPFFIYMGAGSLFEVTETATLNATKADYGIYGPETGDYAVFKAKDIVAGAANQGYEVTYGNNLAVVCETHFANGKSGNYPYIDFKGNATIYEGGANADAAPDIEEIKESLCSGSFTPGSGTGTFLKEPQPYTYAFEDQKVNGDYDMNDVVLKISYHAVRDEEGRITEIQHDKLDVKMVAAGATFNLEAYIGDHKLFDNEVHAAFGVDPGLMVNTGRNTASIIPEDLGVDAPEGWDGDFKNLDVKIHVLISEPYWIEYLTDKVKVSPYAIMIPNDWRWPTERTCVTEAYPGKNTANAGEPVVFDDDYSFRKWAETPDADRTDAMKSWFNYYLEGKTMTNASTNSNN